jgi:hypothetical protein
VSGNRTRVLEAARRVAYVWMSLRPEVRDAFRTEDVTLAAELDGLFAAVEEPEAHRIGVRKVVSRGRAENGYQPETEYLWTCSCRSGRTSGDMGTSPAAKSAADWHYAHPTEFPGWLE